MPSETGANISIVDYDNSTSTALTGAATFTGRAVFNHAPDLAVRCKSDVAGTLYVDFSWDEGTTWDTQISYTVSAGSAEYHTLQKGPIWHRVRYVNGSAAQSYFRLSTTCGPFRQGTQSANRAVTRDVDAVCTRPSDYKYESALGLRTGLTTWHKFGYNSDVDTGTEVVASFGSTFSPLSSASTLSIVSTDATDDSGSTGANSVVVYGVDANWAQQIEVVTMDGTTPVVTSSTWLGINRIAIYLAGTGKANAGTITATAVTGGAVQAQMPAGEGTTQQCIFFVRDNHQVLMDSIMLNAQKLSGGGTPVVTFKGWVFSAVSNAKYQVMQKTIDVSVSDYVHLDYSHPFVIGEKSAFWIEATTNSDNTSVSARFSLIEVADA